MSALFSLFKEWFELVSLSWSFGVSLAMVVATLAAICWKMPVGEVFHGMRRLLGSLFMAPIVQLRKSVRFFQEYSWETFRSLRQSEQFLSITFSHILHAVILGVFAGLLLLGFSGSVHSLLPESLAEKRDSTMSQAAFDSIETFSSREMRSWSYKDLGRSVAQLESKIARLNASRDSAVGVLASLDAQWQVSGADSVQAAQARQQKETDKAKKAYESALTKFGSGINESMRAEVVAFLREFTESEITSGSRYEVNSAANSFYYRLYGRFGGGLPEEQYRPTLQAYAKYRHALGSTVDAAELRAQKQPAWRTLLQKRDEAEGEAISTRVFLEPVYAQRAWHVKAFLLSLAGTVSVAMLWVLCAGLARESLVLMLVMANNLHQIKLAQIEGKRSTEKAATEAERQES